MSFLWCVDIGVYFEDLSFLSIRERVSLIFVEILLIYHTMFFEIRKVLYFILSIVLLFKFS